ncbi:MAG: double-strand break repair helicase AddA, partial [Alphaproteobacteria bacterium]
VVRLLLAGVDPAQILCLTFTKAAAAEMAGRVFRTLAGWTALDDAALAAEVGAIEDAPPSPERLADARRLFARALDTPGGLKIQTIHAFCERLLQQFPFEANVAGGFEVLEDVSARAMRNEARRRVWSHAAAAPEGPLGGALAVVLAHATDFVHEVSIVEFIERRDLLRRWIDNNGGSVDAALAAQRRELGLGDGETMATIRADILGRAPFAEADLQQLHARLSGGGKKDSEAAARLAPALAGGDADRRATAYLDFYRKNDGDFRAASGLVSKRVRGDWPGLEDNLAQESVRLIELADRLNLVECHISSAAMMRLADAAIGEYEAAKRRTGTLDFEDLVVKAARLLTYEGASAWVQYKLDRGIRHILVDEAQDTSPRQWEVVQALTSEFFAGAGAVETDRTVFAVGDEKQSIYSFQGAVPAWFGQVRTVLKTRAAGGGYPWRDVPLRISYRSVPAILAAVDRVFAAAPVHRGVTFEAGAPVHEAHRRNEPGQVTIWPLYEPPEQPSPQDWASPIDHLGPASPEKRLARDIAATVAGWLRDGATLAANGARISAGDILILTRTRGALNEAINRALKRADVAIAGIDRLALTEHIAVMDLLALGRFTQLPSDDLSLAAVLKSPLLGLDDDALYRVAHGRTGSLWEALKSVAEGVPAVAEAVRRLRAWRRVAGNRSPHGFFARILAARSGRQAFLARLGPEADDVLDEFLSLALEYEQSNIATMQGFVAWLSDAEIQIKRDADTERDEVRVMTVHGAKGLEAPIVFLIDNGSMPVHSSHYPRLLPLPGATPAAPPRGLVWNRGASLLPQRACAALDAWRERAGEEYRRLLYVGMTRACDRLYVSGIAKKNNQAEQGWYRLVRGALEEDSRPVERADGGVDLLWQADSEATAPVADRTGEAQEPAERPAWLDQPAPPPQRVERRLSPSTAIGWTPQAPRPPAPRPPEFVALAAGATDGGAIAARERGDVIHRLLQSLPDRAAAERPAVAAAYLQHVARDWPLAEREAVIAEVLAVLATPEFAPVFAPGSRAEVDIVGRVADALVSGRIDRLAVTADRVLIADFKTGREVPATVADIPRNYVVQMALYRRLLERIYPGRAVAAALIWTAGPTLMALPEDVIADVTLGLPAGAG